MKYNSCVTKQYIQKCANEKLGCDGPKMWFFMFYGCILFYVEGVFSFILTREGEVYFLIISITFYNSLVVSKTLLSIAKQKQKS